MKSNIAAIRGRAQHPEQWADLPDVAYVFATDMLELIDEIGTRDAEIDRLRAGLREAIEDLKVSAKYDSGYIKPIARLRSLLEDGR